MQLVEEKNWISIGSTNVPITVGDLDLKVRILVASNNEEFFLMQAEGDLFKGTGAIFGPYSSLTAMHSSVTEIVSQALKERAAQWIGQSLANALQQLDHRAPENTK